MAKRAAAGSRLKSVSPEKIYQFHIALEHTEPLVWRRILVSSEFSLQALHSVLQMTMGWQMSHLYGFTVGKKIYSEPDDFARTQFGEVTTKISAAIGLEKSFRYDYDFGDDWRHVITVEAMLDRDPSFNYPICIGGANACPPEDCGSIPGFENLKAALSDKDHAEHDDLLMWVGGYFDFTAFDPNRINRDMLWMTDFGSGPNDQGLYHPYKEDDGN